MQFYLQFSLRRVTISRWASFYSPRYYVDPGVLSAEYYPQLSESASLSTHDRVSAEEILLFRSRHIPLLIVIGNSLSYEMRVHYCSFPLDTTVPSATTGVESPRPQLEALPLQGVNLLNMKKRLPT